MTALLDVNVLIALAWPNHVHHQLAVEWFARRHRDAWATCPTTQSGFVRVSANRTVLPEAKSPREALDLLRRITALPRHVFWADDIALTRSKWLAAEKLVGYRQVSDAHLLALALRRGGCLATLDGGIRDLVPDGISRSAAVHVLTEP